LKGEKAAKNQGEEKWEEFRTYWMQTNTKLEALKTNFNDCQEKADMSSKTQPELESRIEQLESGIEQYERLYKKHLMLESELTEAKAKEKVVGVFKTDLDKIRDEIGRDVHQYQ